MEDGDMYSFVTPLDSKFLFAWEHHDKTHLAWKVVGNAIHDCHSILGPWVVWNFSCWLRNQKQADLQEAMTRHQGLSWTVDMIEAHEDELGLFLVWADPSDITGDDIEPSKGRRLNMKTKKSSTFLFLVGPPQRLKGMTLRCITCS